MSPSFKQRIQFRNALTHLLEIVHLVHGIREPGKSYPVCLDGKRACPPEDVGGLGGYGHFLNVMRNPNHREHESLLGWYGSPFDPAAFDLVSVNKALRRIK